MARLIPGHLSIFKEMPILRDIPYHKESCMPRVLFILFLSISLGISAQDTHFLLQQLDTTLEQIDALEEYGPPSSLKGLECYLRVIDTYRMKTFLSAGESALLEGILERLFSRYAYRDGSQRSRIYAEAHRRVITLLDTTDLGKELLRKYAAQSPLVQAYIERLT